MARRDVPGDEWVELVPMTAEDDYSVVVEDQPILLYVGDRPSQPLAGLPLADGAMYSLEADRFEGLYARAQGDVSATVRVVPNLRVDGSNERAVSVATTVQTDSYDGGGDFDTGAGDIYPIEVDPAETVQEVILSIVGGEVDVELTTAGGDVVTLPYNAPGSIDAYDIDSFVIKDGGSAPRVAGGWAGE